MNRDKELIFFAFDQRPRVPDEQSWHEQQEAHSLEVSDLFKDVTTPLSLKNMFNDPAGDNCMAAIGRAFHLCVVLGATIYPGTPSCVRAV